MRINLPVTQRENDSMWSEELICSKTDDHGIITYANGVLCSISGFSEKELIGQPHNIMRHPDMPCVAYAWCWDMLSAGGYWRGVVKNRCKNGDHYWVEANISPQRGADGNVYGYYSIRRKATRQQIAEAEALYATLRQAEGELQERGRLSRQAVHELYVASPLYQLVT